MSLLKLRTKVNTKRKRIGRGNSAGQGSTCGRGNKGQGQRAGANIKAGFEGGQTPYLRKMPKLKGFNNPNKTVYQIVKLDSLNIFDEGETVNTETLLSKKLISKNKGPVKLLLGREKLTKKLKIEAKKASKTAIEAVKEAGSELKLV